MPLGHPDQARLDQVEPLACGVTDWATSWMLLLAGMPVPMSRN
ncbi:MAG TPA: hypothetical protein VFX25_16395 [Streptosporangiaceae bacterium]|nr:hypothetical protein [Streptosporangiaceae bacterium]